MDADSIDARVARLEERVGTVHTLLTEMREEQKAIIGTIARASGGFRLLLLLGGLGGILGAAKGVVAWASGWVSH